jgi:hypothetical protein
METSMKRPLLTLILCAAAWAAQAQTLTGVTVEPATAKVGEPVKITANFSEADNPNCNVKLHLGDGREQMQRLNQPKDVPMVVSTSYDKAGEYQVQVEPKNDKLLLKCLGKKQFAKITVLALEKMKSTVKSVTPEGALPGCPAGWMLNKASMNKKTGAFTCTAKPKTALPQDKLVCPAPLKYFDSQAKGQLGCKP